MNKKRKNGNGEGSLRQRSNGLFEYRVTFGEYTVNGHPKSKSFYGHTKNEAMRKYKEYYDKKNTPFWQNCNYANCPFNEWANLWYANHKDAVQESTYVNYKFTLDKLIAKFGDRDIATIKAMEIEQYLKEEQAHGCCDSTLTKLKAMLYQIMDKAVANDLIPKNPVQYVDKIKKNGPIVEKDSFTVEEYRILFEKLPNDWIGNSMRLMLCTGIRPQELLALEPKHISADGSKLIIEQAIKDINGKVKIGPPKTKSGYRTITIPQFGRQCAVSLRNTRGKYICQRVLNDVPCTEKTYRIHFKKCLENLGIRTLTPHECRHTYISLTRSCGANDDVVQRQVGHSDISMTKHYTHVQESVIESSMDVFNDFIMGT